MRRAISTLLTIAAPLVALAGLPQPAQAAQVAGVAPAGGAASTCPPWEPASAPYRGDPVAAVKRLPIAADEKDLLLMMVQQRFGGVRAYSGAAGVEGPGLNLANRRNMNGAGGHVCAGATNYTRFPAGRREVGWVYVAGRSAVIVYDSCGNVEQADNLDALPEPAPMTRELLEDTRKRSASVLPFAAPADSTVRELPEPVSGGLVGLALLAALVASRRRPRGQPPQVPHSPSATPDLGDHHV